MSIFIKYMSLKLPIVVGGLEVQRFRDDCLTIIKVVGWIAVKG